MVSRLFWRQLVVLLLAFSLCLRADAQALPAFTGVVNKVLGKVIQQTGLRRGFAANDPRMATTITGAGTVAASVAADVAISAATAASAPVWLSVAAGLGAAAVVGGLAYGAYKLFFDDSSSQAGFTVQKSASSGTPLPSVSPTTGWTDAGTNLSYASVAGRNVYVGSPASSMNQTDASIANKFDSDGRFVRSAEKFSIKPFYAMGLWWTGLVPDSGSPDLAVSSWSSYMAANQGTVTQNPSCTATGGGMWHCTMSYRYPWTGAADNVATADIQVDPNPYYSTSGVTVKGTISDIVANMDSSELAKPADAATVAFVANALWQRAASQPGYLGLPYSASDPVTASDASAVQAANPASWPKNSDLVAPVAQAANQPVPIGDAATSTPTDPSTGIGTNVNVVNNPGVNILNTPNVRIDGQVDVNWGNAPSVNEPTIEGNTPTAQQIVAPIINLMSGLRTFVVPSHSSECPSPSFDLFGKTMVMDTHCKVLEPVRPTLFAVMAFVWVVVGTFIVLRA